MTLVQVVGILVLILTWGGPTAMTADEIRALRPRLQKFLRRFDDCFLTDSTRDHLRAYVWGQLSGLPRKSIEPIVSFRMISS